MSFNTIPPNDFGYWETINELVQQEPAGAGDPELLGLLAAVGIVNGQPFEPDERMRKILEDAVVVGNATARTVTFAPRPGGRLRLLPGLGLVQHALRRRLRVPRPAAADHRRRASSPSPSDGARKLNSRIAFFYPATGITPAMCMRLTGIGSQYLMRDARQRRASTSTAAATTGSRSRPTSPRAASGR